MAGERVEAVHGRAEEESLSEELVDFWVSNRVLGEADARERLASVVCVLRTGDGQLAGTCSAVAGNAPLLNRPMWMYRRFLAPGVGEEADLELLGTAVRTLAEGFTGEPGQPIGVCVLADRELIERRPEAVWPDPEFVFAGYAPSGAQVRLHYFDGARI